MTTFDLRHLDQLSPEQRQQFDQLLDQFPQLASKMDTSRHLDTPGAAQRSKAPAPQAPQASAAARPIPVPPGIVPPGGTRPSSDQVMDYQEFNAPPDDHVRRPSPTIPTIKIDPDNNMFEQSIKPARDDDDERPERKTKDKQPEPEPEEQRPEVKAFSPLGKVHPVLAKLRATLGMAGTKPPYVVEVGGMKYEMHALSRGQVSRASVMAALASLNDQEFKYKIENSITAFSVDKIDGVPVEDVFQIPETRDDDGLIRPVPIHERREMAAQALFDFLDQSPSELTDTLAQHYNQEFPPLEMVEKGKKTTHCGAPGCQYTRIIPRDEQGYCPYHGTQLADEDALPNPS